MIHTIEKEFKRVKLSPLLEQDIELLRLLRNKAHNRKWFICSEEISKATQEKWYTKYKEKKDDYMFSISTIANPHVFIGAVGLYNIDTEKRNAEFGRLLIDSENISERGLGIEATCCAVKIGFEIFNLEDIYLEVLADNKRAISTYKNVGFIETEKDIINNIICMSINKDNFKNK